MLHFMDMRQMQQGCPNRQTHADAHSDPSFFVICCILCAAAAAYAAGFRQSKIVSK